ncbi:phosphoethanolamine transferase domain-containing protein [Helicobacter sp. 11S02596-1]|uniref:phosphoethanolamine transferase domain-containing protein n=1 Tax=Helicobacter sp. 11S02596-1 TaxID=1476194 RepID=UPI000BA7E0B6|nr:phosphoethanolamine transferase domain-containing protein [Helicobacter sp. 11S02596-1]
MKVKNIFSHPLSYHWVIFVFSVILVGFYNDVFWLKIYSYVQNDGNSDYSLMVVLFFAYVFIIALAIELLSMRAIVKWVIGILIAIAGVSQYYMQSLDITINNMVIESLLHTNATEVKDFLTIGLLWSLLLYVVLPIGLLCCIQLKPAPTFLRGSYAKIGIIALYLLIIASLYLWRGGGYRFCFQEFEVDHLCYQPDCPDPFCYSFGFRNTQARATFC